MTTRSEIRDNMQIDWDVPIEMDDGIVLRADVFRPIGEASRHSQLRSVCQEAVLSTRLPWQPAGTPDVIIDTLNKALQNTVTDPALVKMWTAENVSVFPSDQRSQAAASALLHGEIARWGQVIRDNNIHINNEMTATACERAANFFPSCPCGIP